MKPPKKSVFRPGFVHRRRRTRTKQRAQHVRRAGLPRICRKAAGGLREQARARTDTLSPWRDVGARIGGRWQRRARTLSARQCLASIALSACELCMEALQCGGGTAPVRCTPASPRGFACRCALDRCLVRDCVVLPVCIDRRPCSRHSSPNRWQPTGCGRVRWLRQSPARSTLRNRRPGMSRWPPGWCRWARSPDGAALRATRPIR